MAIAADVNARPRPVFGLGHQPGAPGVPFHVPNQPQEMAVGFYQQRLVTTLINMAVPHRLTFRVITLGVSHGDAPEERSQIAVRSRVKDQIQWFGIRQ